MDGHILYAIISHIYGIHIEFHQDDISNLSSRARIRAGLCLLGENEGWGNLPSFIQDRYVYIYIHTCTYTYMCMYIIIYGYTYTYHFYRHLLDHLCDEGDEHAFIALFEYLYSLSKLYHRDEDDIQQNGSHTVSNTNDTISGIRHHQNHRTKYNQIHTNEHHDTEEFPQTQQFGTYHEGNDKNTAINASKKVPINGRKSAIGNDYGQNRNMNTKKSTKSSTKDTNIDKNGKKVTSLVRSPSSVAGLSPTTSVMTSSRPRVAPPSQSTSSSSSSVVARLSSVPHHRRIGDAAVPEFAALDFLESIEYGKIPNVYI